MPWQVGLALDFTLSTHQGLNGGFHWPFSVSLLSCCRSAFYSFQRHLAGVSIPCSCRSKRGGADYRAVILNNRIEEAFTAFKATQAETSDTILSDEDSMRADFELLHVQTAYEKEHAIPPREFLKSKSMRKRCLIGFLTTFGAQCTATIVINSQLLKSLCLGHNTDIDRLRTPSVRKSGL
jgi:hypothetical protein